MGSTRLNGDFFTSAVEICIPPPETYSTTYIRSNIYSQHLKNFCYYTGSVSEQQGFSERGSVDVVRGGPSMVLATSPSLQTLNLTYNPNNRNITGASG
jgi:hypothetical protein